MEYTHSLKLAMDTITKNSIVKRKTANCTITTSAIQIDKESVALKKTLCQFYTPQIKSAIFNIEILESVLIDSSPDKTQTQ